MIGAQQLFALPSLNDLNLRLSPFYILATTAVVQANPTQHDDKFSPHPSELSETSPISTPHMNLSTIDGWEAPHTARDDNTCCSGDEPRWVYWNSPQDELFHSEGYPRRIYLLPLPFTPSKPRKMKSKLEMGVSFPNKWSVSASLRCLQTNDSPNKRHSRTVY